MSKLDWRIAVTAILTLGGLEGFALAQGVDGALFTLAAAAIAGIAGFKLRR